jgi:hypothetical protein
VASPIKSQYLYVVLESIFDKLPKENRINEYNHFKNFIDELIPLLPSFSIMEDYLPENDWGEIKYFLNERFYKIFYGGDLSNAYDYYYSFEIIHKGFEKYYIEKLERSPLKELELCVSIQDAIINGIDYQIQDKRDVEMATLDLPPEAFWQAAIKFLDNFDPGRIFNPKLIDEYTKDLDTIASEEVPSEGDFLNRAHAGKNCFYFFFRRNSRILPVLPRRFFAILFDKWGKILSEQYPSIMKEVKYHEIKIGVELHHFIQKRTKDEEVFSSAIQADLAYKAIFTRFSDQRLHFDSGLPSTETNQQKIINFSNNRTSGGSNLFL